MWAAIERVPAPSASAMNLVLEVVNAWLLQVINQLHSQMVKA